MSVELIEFLRKQFPHFDAVPDDCVITGGPVRDALLGLPPADLDLASFDAPAAAESFSRRTGGNHITLGTRFRTERVVARGRIYDFSPIQGGSIEDDLERRDFTINAMALRLDREFLDPVGGRRDLSTGIVRMVRESNLTDDPLRILRAPRMTGAFGFQLDPATIEACRRQLELLPQIPAERITWELRLILESAHPRRAGEDMRTTGLDVFTLGFELEGSDLDSWERLWSLREKSSEAIATIALLYLDPARPREWFLETGTWRRDEVRKVESTLRILDATESEDRSLLLTAAEEGRTAAGRAAAVLEARSRTSEGARLQEILERSPSPFEVRPLLDGNEIAAITGATGSEIGRLKRLLWEKQVSGAIRTIEDARASLVERETR